jgi:hypothetical protein
VAAGGPGTGPTAWVTTGEKIVPVDLTSLKVGPPVAVGHLAEAIAVSGGTSAWVAGQDATVTAVDLSTGALAPPVSVGGRPAAIVIAPPRR